MGARLASGCQGVDSSRSNARISYYGLFQEQLKENFIARRKAYISAATAQVKKGVCPCCGTKSVRRRFTWKGLFCALLLFPCGVYCALRSREFYCLRCHCVMVLGELPQFSKFGCTMGYKFREWTAKKGRIPAIYAEHPAHLEAAMAGYRNAASTFTPDSHDDPVLV